MLSHFGEWSQSQVNRKHLEYLESRDPTFTGVTQGILVAFRKGRQRKLAGGEAGAVVLVVSMVGPVLLTTGASKFLGTAALNAAALLSACIAKCTSRAAARITIASTSVPARPIAPRLLLGLVLVFNLDIVVEYSVGGGDDRYR